MKICLKSGEKSCVSPAGRRYFCMFCHHFHRWGWSHGGRRVGSGGGGGQWAGEGKADSLAIRGELAAREPFWGSCLGERQGGPYCPLWSDGERTLCEHCERRDWSVIGVNIGQQPEVQRHPRTTRTSPSKRAHLCHLGGWLVTQLWSNSFVKLQFGYRIIRPISHKFQC